MESLSEFLQDHNIYFNFFSFANLLATVFTFLVGLFLVTLKNRSKSTTHLGMVFMWMAPFGLAYVFAHSYYGPEAAYHRWITVGIILFPLIHMAQWCFKYPENIYPILSRVFLSVQYLVSFVFTVYFILLSLEVGIKFNFAGHHFDFDADQFSSDFGKIIMLYMLLILVVTVWKIIVTKTSERWTVLAISFAMLASTLPVGYLNVASRDGYISRGTFATMFVIMTVIGYFIMVVLYINHTSDRTSFMAKIVGISLVSFLVMMQVISLLTLRSREKEYDALHVEYV
ncbi:MAG: hypothetical protein KDK27_07260 [Leptospiraceae bacterium]|nr:hypothetical protein [Leptospiraceae bacterium]